MSLKFPTEQTAQTCRPVIVYDGPLLFWRNSGQYLDLVIAMHQLQNCMEVACYNPQLDCESPRLYLDCEAFREDLNAEYLQEKLEAAREQWLRHVKIGDFDAEQTARDVLTELMGKFILARLEIAAATSDVTTQAEASVDDGDEAIAATATDVDDKDGITVTTEFALVLVPHSTDKLKPREVISAKEPQQHRQVVRSLLSVAPVGLNPIVIEHHRAMNAYQVGTALNLLQRDTAAMNTATHLAELATSSLDGFRLMMQERRRLQERHSLAQLRWLFAIHRVITLRLVKKLRQRVRRSKLAVWYKESKLIAEAAAAADSMASRYSANALLETLLHGAGDFSPAQLAARHKHALRSNQQQMLLADADGRSQQQQHVERHFLKHNVHRHDHNADSIASTPVADVVNEQNAAGSIDSDAVGEVAAVNSITQYPHKLSVHGAVDTSAGTVQQQQQLNSHERGRRLQQRSHHHHRNPALDASIFELEPHHRQRKLKLIVNSDVSDHHQQHQQYHSYTAQLHQKHQRHESEGAVKVPEFIAKAASRQAYDVNERLKTAGVADLDQAFCGNPANVARNLRSSHQAQDSEQQEQQKEQQQRVLPRVLGEVHNHDIKTHQLHPLPFHT